jgi:NADPH-dependent glutamate synthase beta subunit-like oxidoreductase
MAEGRTHRPVIQTDACGPCGVCRGACPSTTFPDLGREKDTLRSSLSPSHKRILAPCQEACPIGQDIPGYIQRLAEGDQTGALGVILRDNPLPAVLGQVCHHPCQAVCASAPIQRPPMIRDLKRYAAQAERPIANRKSLKPDLKVAVVGSGPAGLSAAWYLAREGAAVTLYEAENTPGGLLAWAIPPFRLERDALARDIGYILSFGIDLRVGQRLSGKEVSHLLREGSRVILACGAPKSASLNATGLDLPGVWPGMAFLRQAALGPPPALKDPVLVIGGGNGAIDAARWVARQSGAVTVVYRRDREEMPAYEEEIAAAGQEGVKFRFRAQPLSLHPDDNGRLARIRFAETSPVGCSPDGRRQFEVVKDSIFDLPAGSAILAVGQVSEAPIWADQLGLKGLLTPDASGCLSPGLYAAGDLVTGPATVVEAMAGGFGCARAILEERPR